MINGWEHKTIKQLQSNILDFRGKTPKKIGMEWGNGDIKALSANNVKMGKIDFNKECYLASEVLYSKWMNKGDCSKNDVVFTMEAPLGNIALIPDENKYILSQRVILFKFKENIDNKYLYFYFMSDDFINNLRENETGSTVKGIRQKKLLDINIKIPKQLKEQQKIAKILTSIDDTIETTNKTIAKQKRIKTGLMQDLLTCGIDENGNIRNEATHKFKDSPLGRIPIEWIDLIIGDICKVRDGTHQTPKYTTEGIPFYSVETITKNDFVNVKYISVAEHKQLTKNYKIEINDVLMTRIGSIGDCKYIDWAVDASFYVSLALLKFDNPILAQYFTQYSNHQIFKTEISLHSLPFAIPKKINLGNISDVRVILPSDEDEQKRIFSILSKQDEAIEQEEQKLKKLQSIKKALMQDLLTGKVRVNYE